MKTLAALLFLALPLSAQNNLGGIVNTNNSVAINGRSYSGGVTDTTEAFFVENYKTLYVNLMTLDSATILIDYALSLDGTNYSAFTVKDSLSNSTANNGFKSVDFTSTILGAQFVKFRFRTSANAFALGTTTPTYTATKTFKRY